MENVVISMCNYILENINDKITIDDIEEIFCYNKFYLIRAFKLYTGYTIIEFINNVKVLKTIEHLLFTNDTILKIALNNGFNSQEYYCEKFKNIIGIPPIQFRKEYNNISSIKDINELKTKKEYLLSLNNWLYTLEHIPNNISSNNVKKLKKSA